MEKIYAAEPNFITEFLARTENATESERKAAQDLYGNEIKESILSYSEDRAEVHISITGPLSRTGPTPLHRYFGYGGTSYYEIIEAINTAEADDTIKRIVFDIDTGGGEVFGVDQVQQAIVACDKKTLAINHGMIASAGYYIASACDKIYAMEPSNMTGSVGVVIVSVDYSKMYEDYGIKVVEVVSRNAPNKRPDVKTKSGKSVLQNEVDAIENVFMTRVSEGRRTTMENVRETYGRGALLVASNPDGPDATKIGMIDGVYKKESTAREADDDGTHVPDISTPEGGITEESMDFNEFMAQNPDAKARYDADINAARSEGVEEGMAVVQGRADVAAKYLESPEYTGAIQALAIRVLKGESKPEALEGAVTAFDMTKEQSASAAAQTETEETPDTPAEANHGNANPAAVATTADAEARMKIFEGVE